MRIQSEIAALTSTLGNSIGPSILSNGRSSALRGITRSASERLISNRSGFSGLPAFASTPSFRSGYTARLNPTALLPNARFSVRTGSMTQLSALAQPSSSEPTEPTNKILWQPTPERIANSQLNAFTQQINQKFGLDIKNYADLHKWSIDSKEQFWQSVAEFSNIKFHKPADAIFTPSAKFQDSQWFSGASLNFAENLLQYAQSHGDKTAIVSILEDGTRVETSFKELEQQVSQLMQFLRDQGVSVGDRVGGIMPNVLETVVAMLATTGVGAVWTSCSPDFGVQSILDRFGQTEPKVLIAADGYQYKGRQHDISSNVANISQQIPSIQTTITVPILDNGNSIGTRWNDALSLGETLNEAEGTHEPNYESVPFNQPAFILYSSGTTGKPKCITHSAGGTLLQHAKELRLHTDLNYKDTHFYFTTCGWMMWNWLTSTLQTGATTVLYDGNPFYPSNDALINLIEKENISAFGASARYYAELEKQGVDPAETFDLSSLKTVMSTGSPLSPASYQYIYSQFKDDLCLASISGGTDIISCFALGNPTLPVRMGELQCFGLGMDVDVYNEEGESLSGEKGELVCKTPFPSKPVNFWGDESGEKYNSAYFETFDNTWAHGDFAEITPNRGLVIYGRSDTILNPGGVRIGTAEIYRQVDKVDEVLESVVVDQAFEGDTRIVLFVRLSPDAQLDDALVQKIRSTIRENTSYRHVPALIAAVPDIPRTFSGKTVEIAVKNIINQLPVKNVGAIANPECLEFFKQYQVPTSS